jgi:MraZ protein
VVGNGSTLEIWNASAWQQYLAGQEDNFSDLSEEVIPGIL